MSEFVHIIDPSGKTLRNDLYNSPPDTASYIIFKDGGLVKAKNGRTGQIEFSGLDAATVIQQALNALTSGRNWMEKVVLKGSFEISTDILLPSYTFFDMSGAVLKRADSVTAHVLRISNAHDIVVFGGKIDGNKANNTVNYGILINNASYDIVIQNVEIYGNPEGGIYVIQGSHDVWIIDCHVFENNGQNIRVGTVDGTACYKVHIAGNVVSGATDQNIEVVDSEQIRIIGNSVHDAGNSGIRTHNSDYIEIIGNVAQDNGDDGFDIYNSTYCIIANNIARANNMTGIIVYGGRYNCIIGNQVVGNGYNGIAIKPYTGITDPSNMLVEGNVVIANNAVDGTYDGINIENATDIYIIANFIRGASHTYGIRETGTSNYNFITKNDLTKGISWVGSNTEVKHNRGCVTENSGTATFSGDGTTTTFNIPHGLVSTPTTYYVEAASADAAGDKYVTADATNLTVTFTTAPPSGTDNVVLKWKAEV